MYREKIYFHFKPEQSNYEEENTVEKYRKTLTEKTTGKIQRSKKKWIKRLKYEMKDILKKLNEK
jgi:ribosomal protein S6